MSEKCAKECATPIDDLTIADMQKAIEERFAPVTHCEVDDLGTCGTSYKVIIVSVSNAWTRIIANSRIKLSRKLWNNGYQSVDLPDVIWKT